MAKKIIIDTDPGQDDAVAILLALSSPELEILGITTVAGNVPLSLTTKNALIVTELAERQDIGVFAGCEAPLFRPLVTAEYVHGATGLDGPELKEPISKKRSKHAVDFIIETLRENEPKSITLCPLGPLTNIASAFQRAPDIIERVKQIVLMGGAYFEVGNITPTAEFNIFVDPEAASLIFKSNIDLVVIPLDVTHKALTTPAQIEKFYQMNTKCGKFVGEMTAFFERFDKEKYGTDGAPLHDPCVIAYLLEPDIFSGKKINVEIETHSQLTLGMTVADWWGVTEKKANALFIGDVNSDKFFDLLTKRIASLP